jgi:hypothetical protein
LAGATAEGVPDGAEGLVSAASPPPPDARPEEVAACAAVGQMHFRVSVDGRAEPVLLPRVCLTWIDGGAPPSHYTLRPYTRSRKTKGPMIHEHNGGANTPAHWCMKHGECGSYFPKEPSTHTKMGACGFIEYERGPADVMVVAYNPWLIFYHMCHLNVEVVCSGVRSVLYLFKLLRYVFKVHETNRAQVVEDGDEMHGTQDREERTHRRNLPRDQVNHWFAVQETCPPYALRGHAARPLFVMVPDVIDLRCACAASLPTLPSVPSHLLPPARSLFLVRERAVQGLPTFSAFPTFPAFPAFPTLPTWRQARFTLDRQGARAARRRRVPHAPSAVLPQQLGGVPVASFPARA